VAREDNQLFRSGESTEIEPGNGGDDRRYAADQAEKPEANQNCFAPRQPKYQEHKGGEQG